MAPSRGALHTAPGSAPGHGRPDPGSGQEPGSLRRVLVSVCAAGTLRAQRASVEAGPGGSHRARGQAAACRVPSVETRVILTTPGGHFVLCHGCGAGRGQSGIARAPCGYLRDSVLLLLGAQGVSTPPSSATLCPSFRIKRSGFGAP